MKKGISFILCFYNCGKKIIPAIESILHQKNSNTDFEIILVDNNSSDDSVQIITAYFNNTIPPNVKLISETKQGLMHARIAGIKQSVFCYLSFIDDDNRIEENWTNKVISRFESDPSIGAIGPQIFAETEDHTPNWFNSFSNDYATGKQAEESGILKNKNYLWGAGLNVRKASILSLIDKNYPFLLSGRLGHELSGGEDGELCMAIRLNNYLLYADNQLHLRHFIPESRMNTAYLIKINQGFGFSWVILDLYEAFLKKKSAPQHQFKTILKIKIDILLKKVILLFTRNAIQSLQIRKSIAFKQGYVKGLIATKGKRQVYSEQISIHFCKA